MNKRSTTNNPNGRPRGTGKYGEPTQTVRVPISMADEVVAYAETRGYRIPLYGNSVSAGTLTPTGSDVEGYLHLPTGMVRHSRETFAVQVEGLSMKDAGILPGDLLVVNAKQEAKQGDIIVAAVNGENTVKRLKRSGESIILQPENPSFTPIQLTEADDFRIQGVVVGVIRNY